MRYSYRLSSDVQGLSLNVLAYGLVRVHRGDDKVAGKGNLEGYNTTGAACIVGGQVAIKAVCGSR